MPSERRDPAVGAATLTARPVAGRPRLARHVRLSFDETRDQHVLLLPESVVVLNRTGAAVLQLCDGQRTVAEVLAELGRRYAAVPEDEVHRFLARLVERRWVQLEPGEVADG
jgi:pyrroloquinoline quinone biosynthesis protein D